jgi:hypothetical protein
MCRLVLANLFLFASASIAAASPPDVCTFKVATTPDFCQTDKEGKFHDNGKNFCGPTAVCNSFVWLADHGFPNLLDKTGGLKNGQIALIHLLANEEQMDTVSKDGTGPRKLMIGIKRYVESKGYEPSRLKCQGWRPLAKPFSSEQSTVSLDWLREGIADPCGAAWINIGWYQRGEEPQTWVRKGGHWMTIAGYGVNENGDNDPVAFVAYDPAPRSGKGNVAHYFHVEEIQSGKLMGEEKGLPRDAAGNYKIIDGIVPKKGMDAVIIDSAVVLILKKPAEK